MGTLNIPHSFTNGYVANANEVNANFQNVKTFAETQVLQSDTKTVFLAPVGSITMYTGASAPAGWLLCDGVTSTAGYTVLASLVGATTPNLQSRFPIGMGALAVKSTGGSATIAEANLPSHTHTFNVTSTAMNQNGTLSHTVTDPGHTHGDPIVGTTGFTDIAHIHSNLAEGTTATAHTHNDSGNAGSINTGAGQSTGSDTTDGMTSASAHLHTIPHATTGLIVNAHDVQHTHGVSGTTNGGTGGGTAYYQPYYVVNFIIKHD
jgi:microcystin-dependent protein